VDHTRRRLNQFDCNYLVDGLSIRYRPVAVRSPSFENLFRILLRWTRRKHTDGLCHRMSAKNLVKSDTYVCSSSVARLCCRQLQGTTRQRQLATSTENVKWPRRSSCFRWSSQLYNTLRLPARLTALWAQFINVRPRGQLTCNESEVCTDISCDYNSTGTGIPKSYHSLVYERCSRDSMHAATVDACTYMCRPLNCCLCEFNQPTAAQVWIMRDTRAIIDIKVALNYETSGQSWLVVCRLHNNIILGAMKSPAVESNGWKA
jgi:hypothetical protein